MQHRRSGFTLLELLLVLGLLVIVAAIATPSIGRLIDTERLRHAGSAVRTELARARVKAMKSGRVHVFRYELDGSRYRTEFWLPDDDLLEAGDESALDFGNSANESTQSLRRSDTTDDATTLPEGVRFFLGQTAENNRDARVSQRLEEPTSRSDGVWSLPILFYSDGTTSTAEVTLANERGDAITVSIRGLTGVAQVSDMFTVEEAQR